MNAVEFLAGPTADLPKTRSEPYPIFMDRLFDEYQEAIRQVTAPFSLEEAIQRQLPKVRTLTDALKEIIALGVAGDRQAAYAKLAEALEDVKYHLSMLMPPGGKSSLVNPMYRFRTVGDQAYTKGGLFHIPFDRRHLVGPMRYSVAKLPSLYLGGSTEVCWRELGRPDLDTIAVSRFEAVQGTGLKVLNFGFRPRLLGAMVNNIPSEYEGDSNGAIMVLGNVVCWPLIAACSVRVPDRSAPDRPEYLVPQMMLEWITKTHHYHGIRYFSTHYSEYPDDPKTYMNYVFPSMSKNATGYCPTLCGFFEMTDPVTWAEAKASPRAGVTRPVYKTSGNNDAALEAEFGCAEDGLLGLHVGKLAP